MSYTDNYLKKMDFLLNVSNQLIKCAKNRCSKYKIPNIKAAINLVLKTKDREKKEKIINIIATNSNALKTDKCTFNKCKKIHIELLKILVKITKENIKKNPEKINSHIKQALRDLVKKIKTPELSLNDINEINKNKSILFYNLFNRKF